MIRPPVPLYGQILVWMGLNLLVVGGVLVLLLGGGMTWQDLVSGPLGDRPTAVAGAVAAELSQADTESWDEILSRTGESEGLTFAVYRPDGRLLAGQVVEMPELVRRRMMSPPEAIIEPRRPRPGPPPWDDHHRGDDRPGDRGGPPGLDGGGGEGGPGDGPADNGGPSGGPPGGGRRDGGGPRDGGPRDGGPRDGGPRDGGPRDGGPRDGGPGDGRPPGRVAMPADRTFAITSDEPSRYWFGLRFGIPQDGRLAALDLRAAESERKAVAATRPGVEQRVTGRRAGGAGSGGLFAQGGAFGPGGVFGPGGAGGPGGGPRAPRVPVVLVASTDSWWTFAGFTGITRQVPVLGGLLLLSAVLWWPLVRSMTQSVKRLTLATEAIAQGRLDTRVKVSGRDELTRLSLGVNHMAARLERFVTEERRFMGDVAHELTSPLARAQMALSLLERDLGESGRRRLADVQDEVEQMTALVAELLAFSKAAIGPRDAAVQSVDLADIAHTAVQRERTEGAVTVQVAEGSFVRAAPDLLTRAVANLIRNAVRYAAASGPIRVTAETEGEHLLLRVTDEGPGVPAEALERLGDPFYRPDMARTRETGGAGLGLAIVRTCAEACGGTVRFANNTPHGFVATLVLRRAVTE